MRKYRQLACTRYDLYLPSQIPQEHRDRFGLCVTFQWRASGNTTNGFMY